MAEMERQDNPPAPAPARPRKRARPRQTNDGGLGALAATASAAPPVTSSNSFAETSNDDEAPGYMWCALPAS